MFYLNSTLNFGIPPVLVFQLEVYYKLDRLLTGLTAQPKGTTVRWYSNKTSLLAISNCHYIYRVIIFHSPKVHIFIPQILILINFLMTLMTDKNIQVNYKIWYYIFEIQLDFLIDSSELKKLSTHVFKKDDKYINAFKKNFQVFLNHND